MHGEIRLSRCCAVVVENVSGKQGSRREKINFILPEFQLCVVYAHVSLVVRVLISVLCKFNLLKRHVRKRFSAIFLQMSAHLKCFTSSVKLSRSFGLPKFQTTFSNCARWTFTDPPPEVSASRSFRPRSPTKVRARTGRNIREWTPKQTISGNRLKRWHGFALCTWEIEARKMQRN